MNVETVAGNVILSRLDAEIAGLTGRVVEKRLARMDPHILRRPEILRVAENRDPRGGALELAVDLAPARGGVVAVLARLALAGQVEGVRSLPFVRAAEAKTAVAVLVEFQRALARAFLGRVEIEEEVLTDGVDLLGDISRHRNAAFPISVLGIGTASGAPIPMDRMRQPGRTLRTQEGNQIVAQLDPVRLREAADLGFGRYRQAQVGDADILDLLSTHLPTEDETIEVEREFDTWSDQGHWVAVCLIPFLLFAFRKGLILCLCTISILPEPTFAAPPGSIEVTQLSSFWESLWQRDDQRARQKLRSGHPEFAAALFEDPQWRAVAQYRSNNFSGALTGFSNDQTPTGLYNQGNALARMQQYAQAINTYNQVLSQQPDHEDALYNKKLVERLLKDQQDSDAQSEQQQSQNNDQQENEDQQQGEDQEQQSDEQQESDQQQQQKEQQAAEAQESESRDEKQEALEQWLRRVPDDPGGLLRRKFSHETKQRLRRGDYENTQGDKIW